MMAETGQALEKRLTRATLRHLRPGPEMEPAHDAGGGPSIPPKREKGLEKHPKSKLCTGYAMPTIEEIRARIRRNFPQGDSSRKRQLAWNRETAHTLITSCGTYRISKMEDPKNPGLFGYALSLAPTPTSEAKHLCGPLLSPRDAREAAQRHLDGEPLQADLS